jgi:hypothetical protein
MHTEIHRIDGTILLDTVPSQSYKGIVIKAAQVAQAMSQRAKADFVRLKAIDAEQAKLRSAYLQYSDLEDEKKAKAERLRRTASVVPNEHIEIAVGAQDADEFNSYIVKVSELPLWEAMLAVLQETGEIQLFELQHVLEQFGKKVTRRAIENAITAHGSEFRAVSKGRERFVLLRRGKGV